MFGTSGALSKNPFQPCSFANCIFDMMMSWKAFEMFPLTFSAYFIIVFNADHILGLGYCKRLYKLGFEFSASRVLL